MFVMTQIGKQRMYCLAQKNCLAVALGIPGTDHIVDPDDQNPTYGAVGNGNGIVEAWETDKVMKFHGWQPLPNAFSRYRECKYRRICLYGNYISTSACPNSKPGPANQCGAGEDCVNCIMECGSCTTTCGDNVCQSNETCKNCPIDCGVCPPSCGDGFCGYAETCGTCLQDCSCTAHSVCGDMICSGTETYSTCPVDCSVSSGGSYIQMFTHAVAEHCDSSAKWVWRGKPGTKKHI